MPKKTIRIAGTALLASGSGTNFKEGGGTGPVRKWGHRSGAKRLEKFLVVSLFCTFLALKVQLVVLVNAFVMVSTVWSISCMLLIYSQCPLCAAICKSGGTCPPCPMESAPLLLAYFPYMNRVRPPPV